MTTNATRAWADIREAGRLMPTWLLLSWEDTRLRYRRSVLGPLWMTIGTALLVAGLGVIWSVLWNIEVAAYLPYLTAGLITWQYLSAAVSEGLSTFVSNAGIIRSLALPYSSYVLQRCLRGLINYAHNIAVFAAVVVIFEVPVTWWTLAFVPGLLLVFVNTLWVAMLLGLVGARYRDVAYVIGAVLPLLMFITPVIWQTEMLGEHAALALLNPFTHYLNIIRQPLLGEAPDGLSYLVVCGLTLIGCALAYYQFRRCRSFITFWV